MRPDRVFRGVAEAPEDLLAVVCQALGKLGGEELGHGDLALRLLAAVHPLDGMVGQLAGSLHARQMLGEPVPPDLEAAYRLPERMALLAVADGQLERAVHERVGHQRGRQPLALEMLHDVVEALIPFAQDVALGMRHSSKKSSQVSEAALPTFLSFLPTR